MGGPAVSVLLREPLAVAGQARVCEEIRRLAETVDGDDFWIEGWPFFVSFEEDYPGELDELAAAGLPGLIGWTPRGVLTLIAMCSGDRSHEILGDLALQFAEQLDGLVYFGGELAVVPRELGLAPPYGVHDLPGLTGALYATTHLTVNDMLAISHYADAAFMRAYRAHPDFRMIK